MLGHLNELYVMATASLPRRREDGQGLVEYALILTLVMLVVLGAVMALGPKIAGFYTSASNSLP